jgi:type I restriction enzyme S subunit
MYGATIGRLALTTAPVTTNQAVAHAVPAPELSAKYLFWFLRTQRRQLVAAGKGGAQPNISQTILKDWQMTLPPLSVQQAIVRQAEEVRSQARRLSSEFTIVGDRGAALHRALLAAAFAGRL